MIARKNNRILFLFAQNDIGGHTKFVLNMIKSFETENIHTEVYVPWFTHFYYTKKNRMRNSPSDVLVWIRYFLGQIKSEIGIRRFQWRGNSLKISNAKLSRYLFYPDKAFLNTFDFIVLTGHFQLKELIELNIDLTKVIYVIHHLHSKKIEEFGNEINRPEFNIVVSSTRTAGECVQLGIKNFKVAKLGVDTSIFKPWALQKIQTVNLKIGFFYYSNSRKNPSLIESIILKLIEVNSDIYIHIFGNGYKRKHDRIFIHENLSEMKYAYELSRLDLFIYISKLEGFGLPPLEAMASGVPVISSNVGAVSEYMDHGEDGYIVSVDAEINEWIYEIEKLISNYDLRSKFSANGVKKAKNWTWDKTSKIYKELIK